MFMGSTFNAVIYCLYYYLEKHALKGRGEINFIRYMIYKSQKGDSKISRLLDNDRHFWPEIYSTEWQNFKL